MSLGHQYRFDTSRHSVLRMRGSEFHLALGVRMLASVFPVLRQRLRVGGYSCVDAFYVPATLLPLSVAALFLLWIAPVMAIRRSYGPRARLPRGSPLPR